MNLNHYFWPALLDLDNFITWTHTRGLIFNLFNQMWPSLLRLPGFMCSLLTPVVKASKGGQQLQFYNTCDLAAWQRSSSYAGNWHLKYYKGLGTSTAQEAIDYFKQMKLVHYEWHGDTSTEALSLAFSKARASDRKEWLMQRDPEATLAYSPTNTTVSFADFVDRDLIHFSSSDVARSLPSVVDGLKPSQRKGLWARFKKNLTTGELRVAHLAGYVSEQAAYHHGEASLQGTITGMAQDFVGSNNINLLEPRGQFGTRLAGGKDCASARYIHTCLDPIARKIFDPRDDAVLSYVVDDGLTVEPCHYLPVLPMLLVNGAVGIGTGFSTTVPSYDPAQIVANIRLNLAGQPMQPLQPWCRGFKGTIESSSSSSGSGSRWQSNGCCTEQGPGKLLITELPVGTWTDDYKAMLEDLLAKGKIKGYVPAYTDTSVQFLVQADGGTESLALLNLTSSKGLSEANMYAFNADGKITKYQGPVQVLEEFCQVRLDAYALPKAALMKTLTHEAELLAARAAFIEAVVCGKLQLGGKP
jgi:DNA topoisomerase-2